MTGIDTSAGQFPLVLRPLALSRVGGAVGGVLMAAIGATLASLGYGAAGGPYPVWSWLLAVAGLLFGLYGLVVAVRYPFLAAILSDDDVLVRGIFASRRILRSQVTGVTRYPAIRWTDGGERTHTAFVNALNVNRARAFQKAIDNSDRGIAILNAWASGISLADEAKFLDSPGATPSHGYRVHSVSATFAIIAGAAGAFSIVARFPRYGISLPIGVAEIGASIGIVAAIIAVALRAKGDRATLVLVGIGSGVSILGLVLAITLGPVYPPDYNQDTPESGGTDSFLELLPSTPITTPSPSPDSPAIDSSAATTQTRYSVNYLLVQLADKLIIPHPANDKWPASVTALADGTIRTSDGTTLGTIPAGYRFTYRTRYNRTDFEMSLVNSDGIGTVVDVGQGTSTALG